MATRILTSHAGSLPRPRALIERNAQRGGLDGELDADYERALARSVAEVVTRQRDAGIDIVNDGEFGHTMRQDYDFGSWLTYVFARLGGVELADYGMREATLARRVPAGEITLAAFGERRDWTRFSEAYGDPRAGVAMPEGEMFRRTPVIRGPVTYTGHEALALDIADLKAALEAAGVADGFLNSVGPASCARL